MGKLTNSEGNIHYDNDNAIALSHQRLTKPQRESTAIPALSAGASHSSGSQCARQGSTVSRKAGMQGVALIVVDIKSEE